MIDEVAAADTGVLTLMDNDSLWCLSIRVLQRHLRENPALLMKIGGLLSDRVMQSHKQFLPWSAVQKVRPNILEAPAPSVFL